jgi:RNA polymerase sigma-70 factor (ECF subfamily)
MDVLAATENEDDCEYISMLYRQYYPVMKKHAYIMTRDANAVEDLVQDTMMRLISKISLLRSLNDYKRASYIIYTLKHVCVDYIRKKTRRSQRRLTAVADHILTQIPDIRSATEEAFVKHEEIRNLNQVLFCLSERDRNLLYYRYILDLKDQEISKLLDIPAQHVRQYVARAKLRALGIYSRRNERRKI